MSGTLHHRLRRPRPDAGRRGARARTWTSTGASTRPRPGFRAPSSVATVYPPNAPTTRRAGRRRLARRAARRTSTREGADARDRELLLGRRGAAERRLRQRATPRRSTTGWRAEWLDRDPRLRAAIVVKPDDPAGAAAEIERLRRRPALRPGAAAGPGRPALRQPRLLAAARGRGASTAGRSRCTSAAPPATRRRRSAGRATTSRSTSAWPTSSRRS